jgi:HEAT repeat protein
VNKLLIAALATALLPAAAPAQRFLGKDSATWIKELSGNSATARRSAAFALGKIASPGAVPRLAKALTDDAPGVRDAAAFALGEIAAGSAQNGRDVWDGAGKQLQDLLFEKDPGVRRSAAVALGSCGAAARTAVPALSKVLSDSSNPPVVRRNAAWALGKIGKAGDAADAVDSLRAALRGNDNPLVLRDLAVALGEIGRPAAKGATDPLARAAQDNSDPVVRNAVLVALVNLVDPSMAKDKGDHKVLVEVLKRGLTEGAPELKGLAAGALANLGEHAAPALSELAGLLDNEAVPAATRRNVALALASMFQAIRNLPEGQKSDVIKKLGQSLAGGAAAPGNQSKLLAEMRSFCAEALARVGFEDAQPALGAILQAIRKDPDRAVKHKAVWFFLGAGDRLKELPRAVETLTACLQDPYFVIGYDAARSLARGLGPDAPPETIDVLERMLKDSRVKVYDRTSAEVRGGTESSGGQSNVRESTAGDGRFMAADALALIGPKAKRDGIISTLEQMTKSTDERIRKSANKALAAINK